VADCTAKLGEACTCLGHEVACCLGEATTAERVTAKVHESLSQVDAWRTPSLLRAEVINEAALSIVRFTAAFAPMRPEQTEGLRRLQGAKGPRRAAHEPPLRPPEGEWGDERATKGSRLDERAKTGRLGVGIPTALARALASSRSAKLRRPSHCAWQPRYFARCLAPSEDGGGAWLMMRVCAR